MKRRGSAAGYSSNPPLVARALYEPALTFVLTFIGASPYPMKWKNVISGLLVEAAHRAADSVRTGLDVGLDLHLLDSFPCESEEPLKVFKALGGRSGQRMRGATVMAPTWWRDASASKTKISHTESRKTFKMLY